MDIDWKDTFLTIARRYGPAVAITDERGSTTYKELFSAAAGVAQRLMDLGVTCGLPVATYLPNTRNAASASYGLTLSGAAEAPINANLSVDEVVHCLTTSGSRLLLTDKARREQLAPVVSSLDGLKMIAVEDISQTDIDTLDVPPVAGDAWGKIVFTSGTTGRPKGIVHSHAGRWLANAMLRASLPIAPAEGLRLLLLTPFSHGASLMTYAYLEGGASIILLQGVDLDDVTARLEAGQVDQILAPPTVLAKLMTRLEGRKIAGISTIFSGTAPLSRELYSSVCKTFGPVIRITYGKSEIFNPITVLTPNEARSWYEEDGSALAGVCVGWPVSGVEIIVEKAELEDNASEGHIGAGPVMVRAPHQFVGILEDGVFSPHAATEFHRTGDVGFLDPIGRLHLTSREADLIKTGGYRVSPNEVEAMLRPALPDVDFLVVGLPSAYWGEVITVIAAGTEEGWETRLGATLKSMTGYKRPRLFGRLDELPRNAMGKLVRSRARDALLDRYVLQDGSHPALATRPVPVNGASPRGCCAVRSLQE